MTRFPLAFIAFAVLGGFCFGQSLSIYTEIAPPNQYLDSGGKLTGFTVELVVELQKRIGNTDPIEVVPWVRAYKELESRPNVLLFSMARSVSRDPLFQWVGPVGESSFVFYVRKDSKAVIHSLEDAKKLRLIGVYKEDARDQYFTKMGFTNLDRSLDQDVMVKKLIHGRIDAIASSVVGMEEVAKAAGINFQDLKERFTFQKVQTYLAFSRDTPKAIVGAWSSTLKAIKKDKTFDSIYRKYYPGQPLPGPETKPF